MSKKEKLEIFEKLQLSKDKLKTLKGGAKRLDTMIITDDIIF